MAIALITRPEKSITDGTYTWLSKWWAVHNPIFYTFARRDYEIVSITLSSGTIGIITLAPGYVLTNLSDYIGKTIYVNSGPYVGGYVVESVSFSGTNYLIYFQGHTGIDMAGGYVNDLFARSGWYLQVNVYKYDFDTASNVFISSLRSAGNVEGNVSVDVSGIIKSSVSTMDTFQYDKVGYWDRYANVFFHISYQELFKDSSTPIFVDEMLDPYWPSDPAPTIPRRYFATKSVRQIQKLNGSNMAAYLGVLPDVGYTKKGDFISDFAKPVYWPGFPWDIAFIASELLGFVQLSRNEQTVDTNETVIGTNAGDIDRLDGEMDGALFPGETRVMLTGSYTDNIKKVFIWIQTGDAFSSRYVADDYVADDYVEELDGPTFVPIEITKRFPIYLNFECYDNPVYLKWKGTQGGWNYWLFGFDQKVNTETQGNGQFEQNISDMETAQGKVEWINKKSLPSMQVGATGISIDNYDGIAGLMESVEVKMLVSSSPYVWQTVLVRPGTVSYTKRNLLFDVDFIIDLPYRNTLSQ